jgi:hypothetical protein
MAVRAETYLGNHMGKDSERRSHVVIRLQRPQERKFSKRCSIIAAILLLPAAAVFIYTSYAFARLVSRYNSDRKSVTGETAWTHLQKRDDLRGGQIIGILLGVSVLLALVRFILWRFSCAVSDLNRDGHPGH